MNENQIEKKKVSVKVPTNLFKKLNLIIVKKYGSIHGHISDTICESIEFWIKNEEAKMKIERKR